MLGFDLVTYEGDPLPVDADMDIRVVLAPNLDETRDRFDLTEGVSGYNQDDILRGSSRVAGDLVGHELTPAGMDRISGIRDILPDDSVDFASGDIILGGLGNDSLEGREGDDILDGDRWLNVQLRSNEERPGTTRRVDALKQLQTEVRNGTINPGNIDIIREIVTPVVPAEDCTPDVGDPVVNCDVAVFLAPGGQLRHRRERRWQCDHH